MKNFYIKISLLTIVLLSFFSVKSNAQIYADVSVDSAYNIIQANILNPDFIILDVRTASEYTSAHIENGVNLDRYNPNLESILDTLNKNKRYLVHCQSGGRSAYVYGRMQAKGYAEVYNMLGGLNAWNSSSYPTTTMVAPIMLPVYDTIVAPKNVALGYTDTIPVTITNYGNDTLKFTTVTDLSGTEFSTDFNTNATLSGLQDYTFNITYTPADMLADTIIFTIESTGGTLQYPVIRNGYALNVDLGADTMLCEQDTLTLDAGAGFDSYLWSTGDTTQTISVDSSQVGLSTALYTVTVTDSNLYEAIDSIYVTFLVCESITVSENKPEINIYPNPSNGLIYISNKIVSASIFNIYGKLVKKYSDTSVIDLSDLPDGSYIARIIADGTVINKKIVLIK